MILDADGAVEVHANVVNDQAINSHLALAGNATLTNNSTAAEQELLIGGNIDSAASDSVQTLTLGGAGNGTISGDLDDGSTGGAIGLTKTDDGVWRLLGASAYTGPTSVSGGTLYVQNLSHSSAVSVNGSGTQLIVNSIQTPILTIGGGEKIALSCACGGGNAARVPEPATGVLLAAAALMLLLRWRGCR
jgi:autotransporter-associated beta strand protein